MWSWSRRRQRFPSQASTTHVTIGGGTVSVSSGIENALRSEGISVTRAAGGDRFGTAAALARTLATPATAYFSNGVEFPDALTTAVLAEVQPGPLLLTRGSCTPAVSLSGLIDTGATHAVLVGGSAVQSDGVEDLAC
jgi:putative cell wall-binding protein